MLLTIIINKIQERYMNFFPKKTSWSVIKHLTYNFCFLKTFNSDFLFNDVWFTDYYSESLEIKSRPLEILLNPLDKIKSI